MPAGLEIFAANGDTIFSVTDSLVKIFGFASVGQAHTGAANSGTIIDTRFQLAQHVPFFARYDSGFSQEGYDALITISGNTLTWTFPKPSLGRPNQTFLYGAY